MKHGFSKMVFLGIIAAWQLSAGTIVQDVTGTTSSGFAAYWGVNFVTPAGGPWNDLTFNFYADSGVTVPSAAGNLYLLSAPYTGAPDALSTGVSGFIAEASVSGGVWTFAPSVTVAAGTQYYVFDDTALMISGLGSGPETVYYTTDPDDAFGLLGLVAINYNFSGAVVPSSGAPEPTTLLLMAPALLLVLRRRLTR
jgi:hypothetical protein